MTRQTKQPTPDALGALSVFWDALAAGQHLGGDRPADSLAALALRLHARDDTPSLPVAERAGIWQEVLDSAVPIGGRGGFSGNGRADSSSSRADGLLAPAAAPSRPVSWLGWVLAHLATAALLLVTVGLAYLVSPADRHRASDPPGIPAIDVAEPLLAIAVPGDYFPTWEVAAAELDRYAFPGGTIATTEVPALRVEYVVSGAFTVRSDGPSQVVRAGNETAEAVPAGTATDLGVGDALVVPPQTVSEYANSGPLAEVLGWSLFVKDTRLDMVRGWVVQDGDTRTGLSPQPGATALRLQRIDLAPDSTFPAPPDALQLSLVWTESGGDALTRFDLARTSDGALRNLGDAPITVYIATVEAAGAGSLAP